MEKENKKINEDGINAILFGDDIKRVTDFGLAGRLLNNGAVPSLKEGHVYTPEQTWTIEAEFMLKNAKTHEDLNNYGQHLNYAINKKLKVDTWDYQCRGAKKMREIYNVIGEPIKGERIKVKRSELN